ncbi:LuxR C-terminal-related transcriptional regulator [Bradyrhizobium rifense]|uniref:LuxR C-terminal-related transcriptional regulator n=1 Tax=Bradyrhizobium rifense TaxID=515499 RepID=UPI003221C915
MARRSRWRSASHRKQIAQTLDQSPNTTHFHVKSIYAKFGERNRATLTALWLRKLR